MEDLQSALQSILSDPAQMARVAALAESLGLKPPDADAEHSAGTAPEGPPDAAGDAARTETSGPQAEAVRAAAPPFGSAGSDFASLMSRLSAMNGTEDRVLNALRPSLSPEGQGRVDRALRAAKLSRLAGRFLIGGGARRV